MEIVTTVDGARATLRIEGKVTVQTADQLKTAISELPGEVSDIDLDLAGTEYVSSAGLRVFVTTSKLAMSRGGAARLLHPKDDVMEVLDMTGLSNVLTVER